MNQQTTGFENNRMYEAERKASKLTSSDFASEQQFEYLQETEDLREFLLSKNWDNYFTQKGPYAMRLCNISIANKIFQAVLDGFRFRMDTVQIFHLITEFYDIDAKWYFESLIQKYRKILQKDLEHRIGKLKTTDDVKIDDDKIRKTFASLFLKK